MMGSSMLFLTDSAKRRINSLLSVSESTGIYISMKTAGCTGLMYNVELAENINPLKDMTVVIDGISVSVPMEYAHAIKGATLDFVTEGFNTHFELIDNPNEKARCGCGESFSI